MVRAIFSIVAGLIVAVASVFVMETIAQMVHPQPPGFDPRDTDAVREMFRRLPTSAFLLVGAGWTLGAGLGAFIAVRVARREARWPGYLVGGLILAATLFNVYTLPHPLWFILASVLAIVIATQVGTRAAFRDPAPGAG